MIKLEEMKELHNFEPQYTFGEVQQNLPHGFNSKIMDSGLYKAIAMLTRKAYPTIKDKYDKRWIFTCRSRGGGILYSYHWR